jgi:hypothetical protein
MHLFDANQLRTAGSSLAVRITFFLIYVPQSRKRMKLTLPLHSSK